MHVEQSVVTPNLPKQGDGAPIQSTGTEMSKLISKDPNSSPQQHTLHPRTRELLAVKRDTPSLTTEIEELKQFKATVYEELKSLKHQLAVVTKDRDKMKEDHAKVVSFHQRENARLKEANGSIETIKALEKENRRMADDLTVLLKQNEEQKEFIRDLEINISLQKAKLRHATESNELKQKIIMEFEKRATENTDEYDAKQIAVLREFQAHRLQDLYQKSRRHLEVERKHNDSLRKTLTESQNVAMIETLKDDINALKEENLKLRKDNLAMKNIQFHQEKEIVVLNERNQKQTIEELDQEIHLLKMQIQKMEAREREQRLHSSYVPSLKHYATTGGLSLDHSRAVSSMPSGPQRFSSTIGPSSSAWTSNV
ncbi:hypothetical protein BCR33DRAFT_717868 [Rhizoclosmatium globosum]|uniref:DUF4515 domain-containing protein n=1 Tax=Rhizoclosmatium globosum TaxID=329046 RepID=A0A1Y2C7X0_9FUNG|nr:hypothetical protein HDU79_008113 [Rhizoclosmatium sp. JEL0117]ORY43132.1 hypothetical protein BCR33DRAFT_717868 [Rhizoclosmatium globosum]|eukprot:ORY43132.1 hypothetical protein BCR33DRAFT_717868 [Rhizoclosmatium globosum]